MKSSLGVSNFLEEISSLSHCIVFLFLCRDHWGRLSYLSLLFSGTLHSNGYIFPFLLCLLLLFFSQLFVRPPQTAILLFCISFFFFFALLYLYSCKVISLQFKKKNKKTKKTDLPPMQEMKEPWIWSLVWEDPLEEEIEGTPVFLLG